MGLTKLNMHVIFKFFEKQSRPHREIIFAGQRMNRDF